MFWEKGNFRLLWKLQENIHDKVKFLLKKCFTCGTSLINTLATSILNYNKFLSTLNYLFEKRFSILKDCMSDSFPNRSGIIFFISALQKHARTVIHMHCALLESVPVQVDGPEMDNIAQVKCCFFFFHNLRCKNWLHEFTHSCFQYNHL